MRKFSAQKKLRVMTVDEIREFIEGDPSAASLAPNGMDRAMMLPYKAILPPDGITIGKFHSGFFNGEAVAIKKLKERVGVEEFKAVLAKMKIMIYLGDHGNVVKFFGSDVSQIASCKCSYPNVSSSHRLILLRILFIVTGQITIVTERSPHGDLLRYLWKVGSEGLKMPHDRSARVIIFLCALCRTEALSFCSVQPQSPDHLTVYARKLNQWCEQIASGMEFLVTKQVYLSH